MELVEEGLLCRKIVPLRRRSRKVNWRIRRQRIQRLYTTSKQQWQIIFFQELVLLHRQKKHGAFCKRNIKGSAKVHIIKLQTLRRDFENMKMKDSETIDEYYTKVRELVNQLKTYGEDIPEKRVVEKLLISVTEKYDPIVTTIEETKDITVLTVTELVGSLEAYEKRRSRREENSLENAFQSKLNMRSQNSNRKEEKF
ncbi:hypothetical protein Sango_1103200 [Sesamum angolense]|uniref:Uncharacterized protein n=1 Tax=Sesamum angolense TaxID=2727404 RepID=A0AAE1WV38_9LAMI|nr:hypothetical protein Sango_1103200 [Sesamum angolense]